MVTHGHAAQPGQGNGNGWRGPLLKALLGITFVLGSWWTGYVWGHIQEGPTVEEVKAQRQHIMNEYPELRERVRVLETRQEEADRRWATIQTQYSKIEELLAKDRR